MKTRVKNMVTEFYKNGDLIPVIGAGCSIPFGSPGWGKLIKDIAKDSVNSDLLPGIEFNINKHNYWEAIRLTKSFGGLTEQDIKEETAKKIKATQFEKTKDNNLKDLAEMDFSIYLTANYDHFLEKYITTDNVPICLPDIDFNSQNLYKDESKQTFHLHGHVSNPGTIVISEESYHELYKQEKYIKMFNLLGGSKAFLFIGMSFDDQFLRALLKDHVSVFKSKSFILLDKSQNLKFEDLKNNYNIEIIEYDASLSDHVTAIRGVLEEIANSKNKLTEPSNSKCKVIGAKLNDKRLEGSGKDLFYQKLKIENIDPSILKLANLYFIAAEDYALSLRRNVVSKEIFEQLLFIVFTTYQQEFVEEYNENKCSESFVKKVHKVLRGVDFSRYMTNLESEQQINDLERQGLIHSLADDPKNDVWWGTNRIKKEEEMEGI